MMLKEKSNPWARLKYLYVIPLACFTVLAFARPQDSTIERQSTQKINDSTAKATTMRIRYSPFIKDNYKPLLLVNGVPYTDFDPNFDFFNSNKEQWANMLNVNSKDILEITRLSDEASKAIWGAKFDKFVYDDIIEIILNKFQTISITHKPDKMPEYPGGKKALIKYLQESLFYPALAQKYGIKRRVVCKFIVSAEGNVSYVKVIRGISPDFDFDAMRVILNMPDWTPGKKDGKNVNVYYKISFKLKKEQLTSSLPLAQ